MKKAIQAVLSAVMMLILAATAFAFDEVLPVDNAGFEEAAGTAPAYWSNINGKLNPVGSFERSGEKHYEGAYSLKISKPTASGMMGVFSAGSFGVHEYRWYEAQAYVYTEDATLTPELTIEFFDMNSSKCASYKVSGTAGKGEWEKLTVTAIAPHGAVMARVMPGIGSGSYGTVYVDAVSLSENPLLKNTAFDGTVDGWAAESGSIAHENGTLKVTAGKAVTNAHYAASGVEYVFNGVASGITGGKAYATLAFLSDGSEANVVRKEVTDGAFSVRGYTPLGVTTVNVYLEAEGEACFDDLLLTPANKGTQIPDGGFEALGANQASPWTIDAKTVKTQAIPGGDFEENDWTLSANYTSGGTTNAYHASGSRAGFLTATYGGGLRSPLIPAVPGTTYTAKMKYLSPTCDLQFYIEFWSDGPVDPGATRRITTTLSRPTATSSWTETSVSLAAPTGTKYMTVTPFFSAGTGGRDRTMYFDDISITDAGGNTVYTCGFEDLPRAGTDWSILQPNRCAIVRDVFHKYDGNACLMLTTNDREIGGAGVRSPVLPAEPGKEYTASVKYITSNTTLYTYLEFWTDETLTTRLNEDRVNLPASSDWRTGSITKTAPAGTKYVTVNYYFLYTAGGAKGWIDEVTLEEVGAGNVGVDMTAEALSEGAYSLKLAGGSCTSDMIPVLSGKRYVAVADTRGDGSAEMQVAFYDYTGNLLDTKTVSATGTASEKLRLDLIAPFKAQTAKITLKAEGETLFDAVELYTVGETAANPSFENTDFICSGKHATQWQSFGSVAALTFGDKNRENPDGTFALELYGCGGDGGVRSSMISVTAGEDYTARIMGRAVGGSLRVSFFDADFALVGTSGAVSFDSDDWKKYALDVTAPAGSVYAALEITADGGAHVFADKAEFFTRVAAVGGKDQLFIDDYLLAGTEGITRTFHQGVKSAPLMGKSAAAHESGGAYLYGTVLYDKEESLYKMWYASYDVSTGAVLACYATSADGIEWEKPSLGLVTYNGSTDNNIIGSYHLQSIIKDENEPDPAKRYQMITYNLDYVYSSYYSADGLSWTKSSTVLSGSDVITAIKDDTNGRLVSVAKVLLMKRNQWTLTGENINSWSVPVMSNTLADLTDSRLCYRADSYGMGLYEKDGVYIGFDWLFAIPGTNGSEGVIEPQLAFSRDLTDEWQRPTRMPIIPLGEAGSIDDGMIVTASNALEVHDEVRLYCGTWDGDHGTPAREANIYLVSWRLDGFASLDSAAGGTIVTRPFTFDGAELYLNADAAGGSIYAELLDENGVPLAGYTRRECDSIDTDSVRHIVNWNGNKDVSALAGQVVSLKLYCENSEVYSFRFANASHSLWLTDENGRHRTGEIITGDAYVFPAVFANLSVAFWTDGAAVYAAGESVSRSAVEGKAFRPLDAAPLLKDAVDYRTTGGTSGIRIRADVSLKHRALADSYGFLVTREAFLPDGDVNTLTFGLTDGNDNPAYAYGESYRKDPETGAVVTDKQIAVDDDGTVTISGVMTGIPAGYEDEVMAARPYLTVGAHTFYGKAVKASVNSAKAGVTID